jgi:hypothetical protein
MTSSAAQLQGAELIDCARANATCSIDVAAERCGYGHNIQQFEQALKKAYDAIGVSLTSFSDLTKVSGESDLPQGEVVAPDTINQL